MAKSTRSRSEFRCAQCGCAVAKWVGRCPECQAWGTIEEGAARAAPRVATTKIVAGAPTSPARLIGQVDIETARARPTGIDEFDRVLGGGLVPGAAILLAGEPGVGKSTLLLEVARRWARRGARPALYITGEESAGQVRLRAERTGAVCDNLYLAVESDLSAVLGHISDVDPGLLIIDSVQTMSVAEFDGSAGGVTQVRAVAAALVAVAKERGLPVVMVGHVTKDGNVAGPRVLEHLVDVVLHFEGDRQSTLRMVRGMKNRFGPADEVGCFEMIDRGIRSVSDPSGLFLNRREAAVPGTAVTVVVEGRRPLPAEVQALVASTSAPQPRRAVSGLDSARVAMVLAVLERRGRLGIGGMDVFCATVGGMKVTEPAADLALALAVASAKHDIAIPPNMIVLGEVGLTGEIRRVNDLDRRLAEAGRLGFDVALVPADCGRPPRGMRVCQIPDLRTAMTFLKGLSAR